MSALRTIADKYFSENPEQKDHVMKAYHAFHVNHFREHSESHHFLNGNRDCECFWCSRSREQVRHDSLPAECLAHPDASVLDIETVIANEEAKAHALFERAKSVVPAFIRKHGLTGESLATLHHTFGFDPETVAGVVDVPESLISDYHERMNEERQLSRKSIKREILTCI